MAFLGPRFDSPAAIWSRVQVGVPGMPLAPRSQQIPVWCGGTLETDIGRAANLALCSLPNFTLPADLSASDRYFKEELIDPPVTLNSDGTITVPTGTDLGVHCARAGRALHGPEDSVRRLAKGQKV